MPMSSAKAAGGGKPSTVDKTGDAGVTEAAIPKLKEEIQKLQATKKHLEEMGCEAAVEEVAEKLAALQQHLQSQKPLSQQLEHALAMQRKAAAGKDKAEQILTANRAVLAGGQIQSTGCAKCPRRSQLCSCSAPQRDQPARFRRRARQAQAHFQSSGFQSSDDSEPEGCYGPSAEGSSQQRRRCVLSFSKNWPSCCQTSLRKLCPCLLCQLQTKMQWKMQRLASAKQRIKEKQQLSQMQASRCLAFRMPLPFRTALHRQSQPPKRAKKQPSMPAQRHTDQAWLL